MSKIWETVIVVTLVAVVICLLFPIIKIIIAKSQFEGIKNGVNATAENVKAFYLNETVTSDVSLPFVVTYSDDGYTMTSNGHNYVSSSKLDSKLVPTGGTITVNDYNQVSVENLRYKNYICNKTPNTSVQCKEIVS